MISDISYGTFSFFGAFTFVSCIICFCLMLEKKGFVLEDMYFIFER